MSPTCLSYQACQWHWWPRAQAARLRRRRHDCQAEIQLWKARRGGGSRGVALASVTAICTLRRQCQFDQGRLRVRLGVSLTVWHSLRAGHWPVTVALASCECHCGFVGWWRFSRPVRRSSVVPETPVPKLRFRYRGLRDRKPAMVPPRTGRLAAGSCCARRAASRTVALAGRLGSCLCLTSLAPDHDASGCSVIQLGLEIN